MTLSYLIVTFAVLFLAMSPFYFWAFTHDSSKDLEHENEQLRHKIAELELKQAFDSFESDELSLSTGIDKKIGREFE